MPLTREADNAVRIVFCLAAENKRMGAAEIAGRVDVTQRFALKTLHKLVGAGCVKYYKGQNGGYALIAKPSDITMYDVIEAVDGPYYFSKCLDGERGCGAKQCRFKNVYGEISKMINEKLRTVTFEALLREENHDFKL